MTIKFVKGNLLEAKVDALVNTVNTIGVMGKGIALMFKERFTTNFKEYEAACRAGEVRVGEMFVTANSEFDGPKWIINFPTKEQWYRPTRLEWIESGMVSLKKVIREKGIKSVAVPPLGCGNGGLKWNVVRPIIERELSELDDVDVIVYEPVAKYQNVAKKQGVEKLTPARAMIAELIRRYWVLGIECTFIEAQKLAWFLGRNINRLGLDDPLKLQFTANRYGPYAHQLSHLLNQLDGSYLHCDKRIADANAFDSVWFEDSKREKLALYLKTEAQAYLPAVEATDRLIDGFQSPLGMEVLATVDWLVTREHVQPTLSAVREGISNWPAGRSHAKRKEELFSDNLLELAIERLSSIPPAE
ncbi:MAG TPA: macro domain-containing protein [Pyrinomonadaceae bacterium]|nr:macro domain-containing protein [Chloracidobacterium sp.]HBE83024.1 Appr-1-p processing protein [Blastocatellia bacterium]HRJ87932.1 macro domain-containing protein [Pyrinomonadaceae bacterium]HRK51859.1 macro domain-containing protein [Pyrinomonadaceae bacterium]